MAVAPIWRVTFFFAEGENGWSESVHSTLGAFSGVLAAVFKYITARMSCCPSSVFLTHVRISDDNVFRDVYLDPVALPAPGTYIGGGPGDSPWTALDVRMTATPVVQRSLFMRGIPIGQVSGSVYQPNAKFLAAVTAFTNQLLTNGWGIKNKDRTQQKQPIASVDNVGNVVLTMGIAGLTVGDTVQFLGIKRSILPKRTYIVETVTSATVFSLRGYSGPPIVGVGFVRKIVLLVLPLDNVVVDNTTERRVGRPFGLLRGRRAVIR